MLKAKLKILPLKESYSNEETSALISLCQLMHMPCTTQTTLQQVVNHINNIILNEYAPPGAVEYDHETGTFT